MIKAYLGLRFSSMAPHVFNELFFPFYVLNKWRTIVQISHLLRCRELTAITRVVLARRGALFVVAFVNTRVIFLTLEQKFLSFRAHSWKYMNIVLSPSIWLFFHQIAKTTLTNTFSLVDSKPLRNLHGHLVRLSDNLAVDYYRRSVRSQLIRSA